MGSALYGSSKKFNKIFARRIYYPKDLYHLIIKPGWVSTPMTGHKQISWSTSSVEEESKTIVRAIGLMRETYGHSKHLICMMVLGCIPEWGWNLMVKYAKRKQQ